METKTTNNKLLFLIAALLLFGSCRTNNENRLFRFEYEVADTTTQKEILLVLRMPERCSGESNKMKIN
ncbi:MAG: hypothetical protein M0P27_10875, partial [Bacteroidales bacterium]|nr:hypothetical protein [Bacteroidales bacterium]